MSEAELSLQEATARLIAPGQMFETERAVVQDRELTVWKNAPTSLRQILDLSLNHATRDFLVYEDQRYTFDEHYRAAATLAARLVELGVRKGDRVAIAARNLPQWVMAFWGSVVTGAVVVPLNAWWTTDELIYGLSDSGTSVLFVDEERLERVRPRLDELTELSTVIVLSDDLTRPTRIGEAHARLRVMTFADALGDVDPASTPPEVDISPDDDATMLYTSGTTGHPKGAVGSHRNVITNLMNLFFAGQRSAMRFGPLDAGPAEQTSGLLNIPFFHATGCHAFMIPATAAGNKIVMMHHFDSRRALELIQSERITGIGGVPTIAMQILDDPAFATFDTSSVKSIAYGGAPPPPDLASRLRTAFPGGQSSNGYGLTETSAGVCGNAGPDYLAKPSSCGPAYPVNEMVIVPEGFEGLEPTDDLPHGPDVVGELWIKGPNVVRGYWNKPEATAEAFTNGWLHTGDIARIDDEGFVYIVDRAKDMIIRGGENVYSVIVEGAIFDHPDVADCAVIGLPHPTFGEEVAAVIVLRPGRVIEAEEIARHVAARLAKFEVPTRYVFRSKALPRNPQGKVLKRELRASLIDAATTAI
ncbi:MAG TPA: class I adenylate-forming enzyme family protein [Acidimicrobiales bacterium]|jgi:long-chain acyl-CoA synthetase|nr:class I adenylate-forming enzyme family protein [Acidimicrobiales bacterium]